MTSKAKKTSFEQFRKKLLAKRKELTEGLNKNQAEVQHYTTDDSIRDYADVAQSSYTKEFLYSLSNEDRRLLQLVDEALRRLAGDTYGVCVACGQEVQRKRLEAVPWARHCIECQERQDQGRL